jgi:hypothetical protein
MGHFAQIVHIFAHDKAPNGLIDRGIIPIILGFYILFEMFGKLV